MIDLRTLGDVLALAAGLLLGVALAWYAVRDAPTSSDPAAKGKRW